MPKTARRRRPSGQTTSRPKESTKRRSPGRPKIPFEKIIDTASQLVEEEGAEALSMRNLAQRLGSGTATLYRHVRDRNELVAHVVDRIFGEAGSGVEISDSRDWQDTMSATARAMFEILSRHRAVAPLLLERIPEGPNAMRYRERMVRLLLDNGFSGRTAAMAYATVAHYVLGFASQLRNQPVSEVTSEDSFKSLCRGLDPADFPAITKVARYLPLALEKEFEFGLQLIVSGLANVKSGERRI